MNASDQVLFDKIKQLPPHLRPAAHTASAQGRGFLALGHVQPHQLLCLFRIA